MVLRVPHVTSFAMAALKWLWHKCLELVKDWKMLHWNDICKLTCTSRKGKRSLPLWKDRLSYTLIGDALGLPRAALKLTALLYIQNRPRLSSWLSPRTWSNKKTPYKTNGITSQGVFNQGEAIGVISLFSSQSVMVIRSKHLSLFGLFGCLALPAIWILHGFCKYRIFTTSKCLQYLLLHRYNNCKDW